MGTGKSPRPRRSGAIAFSLLLSLGALFLYRGDLGKWREDFAWTARDPLTDRADWGAAFEFPFFWRPCSLVYVRAINTLFWSVDPARHVLAVLAHVFAGLMLRRAMIAWGVSRTVATFGALGFLVQPNAFEVVFWPSATPTALATGLFFLIVARVRRAAETPTSARTIAVIAAISTLIPCWNEQPAAGLAAVPLLLFALPAPARSRFGRAAVIAVACGLPCVLYVCLYLATGPWGSRGALGSYTEGADLISKSGTVLGDAAGLLAGKPAYELVRGSWKLAAPVLSTHRGIAWIVACAATGAFWVERMRKLDDEPPDQPGATHAHTIAVFALVAAMAMLVPIVAIRGIRVEPRMLYAPAGCLILGVCRLLTPLVRSRVVRASRFRTVGLGAACAVLVLGGSCLIGFQAMLKRRSQMDWAEARAIKLLAPNPPPDTLFLAVRVSASAAGTGYPAFDREEFGAWSRDAYGSALLRHVYGRADLYSKRFTRGPEIGLAEDGLTTGVWLRPGYTRGIIETRTFPWDRVILFIVEKDGTVRLAAPAELTASPSPSAASSPGSRPPPERPSASHR